MSTHAPLDCPTVTVNGPIGPPGKDEPMRFTATVDPKTNLRLNYEWKLITRGAIMRGQGSPAIEVFPWTNGTTVSVEIEGLPIGCRAVASETLTWTPAPVARKLYQFSSPFRRAERAGINRFIPFLHNNRYSQLYILVGAIGAKPSVSTLSKERQVLNHLRRKGIEKHRITFVRVFALAELMQFWEVPPGAKPPECQECKELEKSFTRQPEMLTLLSSPPLDAFKD